MQDNIYGYGGVGDVGHQHKRCGTAEMAKWVRRMAKDWANINK